MWLSLREVVPDPRSIRRTVGIGSWHGDAVARLSDPADRRKGPRWLTFQFEAGLWHADDVPDGGLNGGS